MSHAERIATRQVFRGRRIGLSVDCVRLPNGNVCELELIRHPGAAAVVPLFSTGEVALIRQYRHATESWLHEVPAGTLDEDEPPEVCATRELAEEAGLAAGRLTPLGWIWTTPGFTDEKIWLYLATELTEAKSAHETDEVIQVERIPFAEAVDRARRGGIADAKSICALLRAAHHLG